MMGSTKELDLLFDCEANNASGKIIIYSSLISERLKFTCDFIFNRVLQSPYVLISEVKEFEQLKGFKINYSLNNFPGIVQIIPQSLLIEKNISEKKPIPIFKMGSIYFFSNKPDEGNNDLCFHFDVFSAVFYLVSRYEEWQSFKKDKHLRFEATESILFQHKFHLKPVVDYWILELSHFLKKKYLEIEFPEKIFKVISTIDVDNLFAYKHKGLARTIGASLKDLVKCDFKNLSERLKVISGKSKDPFDIYESVSDFCFELKIPLIYFFLMRTGTAFDRTVNPASSAFDKVFRTLKTKNVNIGLHPSYNAAFEPSRLKNEHALISSKLVSDVTFSRQHFLRFDIRTTPSLLLKNGIHTDYSMGFASTPGFRAGTSHPFQYYNFSKEETSKLLFVPFCTMDGAYFIYDTISPDAALESMYALAKEVKKAGGFFISVFHERTFSNHLYPGFSTLYKNLHLRLKEL